MRGDGKSHTLYRLSYPGDFVGKGALSAGVDKIGTTGTADGEGARVAKEGKLGACDEGGKERWGSIDKPQATSHTLIIVFMRPTPCVLSYWKSATLDRI